MNKKFLVVRNLLLIGIAGVLLLFFSNLNADAAEALITKVEDITTIVNRIYSVIQALFWIATSIFLLLAGYYYMTSKGDAAKLKTAQGQLIYAVVGIAIGVMLATFKSFITNLLTITTA